ncbi:MAG: hypothetical protein ACJAXQ_000970 [Parvibaculaceae bacterium]|jgi:hypothetical protein
MKLPNQLYSLSILILKHLYRLWLKAVNPQDVLNINSLFTLTRDSAPVDTYTVTHLIREISCSLHTHLSSIHA